MQLQDTPCPHPTYQALAMLSGTGQLNNALESPPLRWLVLQEPGVPH